MATELFTVNLKDDGNIDVKVNEDVLDMYGMTLEDFSGNFETENLYKGIQDFTKALDKGDKINEEHTSRFK